MTTEILAWLREQGDLYESQGLSTDAEYGHKFHATADALVLKDETIQAMESVLAKIGEHLKISPGDVPGLFDALEQKQTIIDSLEDSLDEAKYDETEYRSKLDKQRQRLEQLEAALEIAGEAIASVPLDTFGVLRPAHSQMNCWRQEELVDQITKCLTQSAGDSDQCLCEPNELAITAGCPIHDPYASSRQTVPGSD